MLHGVWLRPQAYIICEPQRCREQLYMCRSSAAPRSCLQMNSVSDGNGSVSGLGQANLQGLKANWWALACTQPSWNRVQVVANTLALKVSTGLITKVEMVMLTTRENAFASAEGLAV